MANVSTKAFQIHNYFGFLFNSHVILNNRKGQHAQCHTRFSANHYQLLLVHVDGLLSHAAECMHPDTCVCQSIFQCIFHVRMSIQLRRVLQKNEEERFYSKFSEFISIEQFVHQDMSNSQSEK